jgi:hypothetical protein
VGGLDGWNMRSRRKGSNKRNELLHVGQRDERVHDFSPPLYDFPTFGSPNPFRQAVGTMKRAIRCGCYWKARGVISEVLSCPLWTPDDDSDERDPGGA